MGFGKDNGEAAQADELSCRAEERLIKSERQLAEAQSIAQIGSWEWDSISDEISGSDEFNRIFGLILSTYDSFLELVHPDDRVTVHEAVQETLSHQAPYNVHYRIIRPDGITCVIHARGAAVTDDSGKTVRMIGTVQDVTERNRVEAALEKLNIELTARAVELECANSDMEAFNYTASHDLRTHLNSIYGFSQILLNLCPDHPDEQIHSSILQIKASSERMDQLIAAILDFSRLLQCEMAREEVALCSIANDIATMLGLASPERRVTFKIAEGGSVCGDARLLRTVLENLIINAWKYSSQKEEAIIEFGMKEHEGETAYFVRDNGVGFDMAHADKLFVAFRRLDREDGLAGHGIGLSTVQRIISRHGGRVWAESAPGLGATFYFTMPDS